MSPSGTFLVSACLCGHACRYDGTGALHPEIAPLLAANRAVPVCPEVLGGLSVPRDPCEICGQRIVTRTGKDCTAAFLRGAVATLHLAQAHGIRYAVLKERSPSCGTMQVYDGTFQGIRITGQGVAADLLRKNGIFVFSEETFSFAKVASLG